jgi:cellulose biosynthesis protein BcsQ
MAITAFANLKGGVGKSLISMGCAHAAAADGKRVLLIDADPQGNTSIQMTNGEISPDTPARASLADVLDRQSRVAIDDAITPHAGTESTSSRAASMRCKSSRTPCSESPARRTR